MKTETTINHQNPPFGKQMLADAVCRPILFSTPMVEAILSGKKNMTRRILKVKGCKPFIPDNSWDIETIAKWNKDYHPYGKAGDILWVRETFAEANCLTKGGNEFSHFVYKADKDPLHNYFKWKPSLFMPKEACRIFLEITEIKVERLQQITNEDCINEGIKRETFPPTGDECYYFYPCKDLRDDSYLDSPKTSFYSLWKSINGQKSWDENPFVWAISFKLVECPYGFR